MTISSIQFPKKNFTKCMPSSIECRRRVKAGSAAIGHDVNEARQRKSTLRLSGIRNAQFILGMMYDLEGALDDYAGAVR